MTKAITSHLLLTTALISFSAHAGTLGSSTTQTTNWNGLYLGGNAGYIWSAGSKVNTTPTQSYFNPDFFLNGEITRRSLVEIASNNLPMNFDSLLLGVQVGYSRQIHEKLVAGVISDFAWLLPSQSSERIQRNKNFVASGLDYTADINTKKVIDYLGTIRGKLGGLLTPTLQAYGTGGYAYGHASLIIDTSIINNGAPTFFPDFSKKTSAKTQSGWTAGGGLEWMFLNNWSTNIEYLYYDLGKVSTQTSLTKLVQDIDNSTVPYASTNMLVSSPFTLHSIRVGINGHFN